MKFQRSFNTIPRWEPFDGTALPERDDLFLATPGSQDGNTAISGNSEPHADTQTDNVSFRAVRRVLHRIGGMRSRC
ncbi:MAG TPA: hypothetical protein VKF42_11695, partial [Chitinivibrionales bacterium]|nr:hypothetical protein [Chitinivibrionales bacterium]